MLVKIWTDTHITIPNPLFSREKKQNDETYKALSLFPIDCSLGDHWGRKVRGWLHERRVTRVEGPESRSRLPPLAFECGGEREFTLWNNLSMKVLFYLLLLILLLLFITSSLSIHINWNDNSHLSFK
jgi:hypothetical protein